MREKIDHPGSKLGILGQGISWWFVRLLPFLVLYLAVKLAFFAGYFQIFGPESSQIVAHDFFVKSLVTVCAVITVIAIQKFFVKFMRLSLSSFGESVFYSKKHANYFSRTLSHILLYAVYLVILVVILNLWMANSFGWMLDLLRSSTTTIFSFVLGIFASSVLGNIVAYYILNRVKEIKPNDRIKVDDTYGDVLDIDLLFTHVKNLDNEIVSIPNIILVTKGIKNYNKYPEVVVHFNLSLPHGTDVKKTKEIIINTAKNTKDIMEDREPTVWFKEVSSWVIECEVRVSTRNVKNLIQIKSDLMENVLTELQKNKIPTGRDIKLYGKPKDNHEQFPPGA